MTYPETLIELLSKYKVSIPIVQRDYVQGLNDTIISELLDDIKSAIVKDEQLRLNFVYGKVEDNLLIPLDGQQRLTTLFLLHLFAFRNMPVKDTILKRFSYETRRSSREFFKQLCDYEKRAAVLNDNSPSQAIQEALWFHTRWYFDPTVRSALACLNKISEKFSDIHNLAEKLEAIENKPIIFNFIPMTDMGMEDSLYIKLNARGRALTDFETYKAELLAVVEKENKLPFSADDFAEKLDIDWSNFFWELGHDNFDKTYRRYFSLVFSQPDSSDSWKFKEDRTSTSLCDAYYTLDYIISHNNKITEYLKECTLDQEISYPQRLVFNSLALFIGKSKGNIEEAQLLEWFRVISNLTANTTIDNVNTYIAARNAVKELSEHCFDLTNYLATSDVKNLGGFSPEQIKEERVKAKLIMRGYRDKIIKAEEHKYFLGQLRSALYMADLSLEKIELYDETELERQVVLFDLNWTKISALFGDAAPHNGVLLRTALLTFGDYMPHPSGEYYSFCVDRAQEATSLKALFSSGNNCAVALINTLSSTSFDEIEKEMQILVAKAIRTLPETNWKYWILKYPKENLGYLSSTYMRMRICRVSGTYTYLLVSKYAARSHCREIFTFALSLELEKAGKKCSLPKEYGRDSDYRVTTGNNTARYRSGKFCITDDISGTTKEAADVTAALSML
ncbi:protein DUF262 [Candidatus Termititenax aidoneus]|uniref:Protein DUF262 n=1 Tax=Termititenax aidoneus TaxID=2218524 RepID=A0A388T8Y4_TERA1|nr:protein DUF262 [Candidatus Termititenax aidoneus]